MGYIILIFPLCFGFCKQPIESSNLTDVDCDVIHMIDSYDYSFVVGDTIKSWNVFYIPLDCNGNIKVIDFYPSGEVLSETFYRGHIASKIVNRYDPILTKSVEETVQYFKRIPFGQWTYYCKNGEVWREMNFSN